MTGPYPSISSQTSVVQVIDQLKKSFPKNLDASTLQALDIAPKNESYVLNILRFLKIIDETGNPVESNQNIFFKEGKDFQDGFSELVKSAYDELFDLHGDDSWVLEDAKLQNFFRTRDGSSQLVGKRKAKTFATLASIAGKRQDTSDTPKFTTSKKKSSKKTKGKAVKEPDTKKTKSSYESHGKIDMAVKLEINLPATTDQEVYRAIFQSLREELLNG